MARNGDNTGTIGLLLWQMLADALADDRNFDATQWRIGLEGRLA